LKIRLIFINVYEILYKSCTEKDYYVYGIDNNQCKSYEIKETIDDDYVKEFLQKLHHNLYKICSTINESDNGYFKKTPEDEKEYCIYFKYWLYDEILSNEYYISNINKIIKEWENKINDEKYSTFRNLCSFNKLEQSDIEKLKRIYAFKLILYDNANIFNTEKNKNCTYLSELGKGLKLYSESVTKCSTPGNEDNYCKEFKEFLNIYKLDKLYLKTSESFDYQFGDEETVECPLVIESFKDPLRLMYKERKNRWHLSDEPIYFLNSPIISASSAMGATLAISAFLLYMFKYTNIRSFFGHGKQKDNTMFLNVDEESHNFTFPISESKYTNFGNNEYKITYFSTGDS
ncbi:PIR Superfamily Protein, partial [Plasmodium ovale curtisi]